MVNFLKWLQNNETIVHIVVGLVVFYGAPVLLSSVFFPQMLDMLVSTALSSILLIALGVSSAMVAVYITNLIKNAVAALAVQDLARPLHEIVTDKTIDLSSDSVIVVKTEPKKVRKSKKAIAPAADVVETAKPVVEESPAQESPPEVSTAKKRPTRSKKSSKES